MRRMKVELFMLLLAVGVASKKRAEVSNKCIGKPDAPPHANVRCFKKNNTCEATCQNGYIFSKKGSPFTFYDCKDGKWVMRDGDDKCNPKLSNECSGKPNTPEHSTVRCFKKHNTCRATCQNGYIFSKKGSKSAIYDCEGGKWVMRDGEDRCHSNATAPTLKLRTAKNVSLDHISSNNGSNTHPKKEVRCILVPGYYHEHDSHDYNHGHGDEYYFDWAFGDYGHDHDQTSNPRTIPIHDPETGECVPASSYLCNGTAECIPESFLCDQYVDCPNEDDELACDHEGKDVKSKSETKTSQDQTPSKKGGNPHLRQKLRCSPPLYYHEHDCYDYHYHDNDYHYYNYDNPDDDHVYDYHYDDYNISSPYICNGTQECIPDNYVCDSFEDCPEGDDEFDCPVMSTTTPGGTTTDSITSTTTIPECGGEYYSSSGRIRHPMDGDNYYNNEYCVWTIHAGTPIKIIFVTFDTENGYDPLTVGDGEQIGGDNVFGYFSGSSVPGPIQTSDIAAYILFTSDSSVTRTGFELYWEPLVTSTTIQSTTTDTTTTFETPVTSTTTQSTTTETTTTFETPVIAKNKQNINVNVRVNIH